MLKPLTPPPLAKDPVAALLTMPPRVWRVAWTAGEKSVQFDPPTVVTYYVGPLSDPKRTNDQIAAINTARDLERRGRVHLVHALMQRDNKNVGTYAYLAISRPAAAVARSD